MSVSNPLVGNLYLDALPGEVDRAPLLAELTKRIEISERVKAMPASRRLRATMDIWKCYFPTSAQLRFADDFDALLRSGYEARTPTSREARYWIIGGKAGASGTAGRETKLTSLPLGKGVCTLHATIIGHPRMGKSKTMDEVLGRYKQRIEHRGLSDQIVWLKVSCPANGLLKSFCISLFEEFDRVLSQTLYRETFGHSTAPEADMPEYVLRLANVHGLGALVMDDIHFLNQPNGLHPIWKFLKNLADMGVPVITVGTMAAADMLQQSAQSAFMSSGFGSYCWERLPKGDNWKAFFAQLWPCQWTRDATILSPELLDCFYHCSQGIIELAIKLYHQVQAELVRANIPLEDAGKPLRSEAIEPDFVLEVFNRFFPGCQPHLDALRSGDPRKLRRYSDLQMLEAEAKRVAEGHAKQAEEVVKPKLEESGPKSHEELLRDQLEATARAMCREAGLDDVQIDKWLAEIRDIMRDKLHLQPREFYRQVEKRIAAHLNPRRGKKAKPEANPPEGDLRHVLQGNPVGDVLNERGYNGPKSFFGKS